MIGKQKRLSGSGLFLMEFMFVVLFFALSSAVCLTMFANADRMSRESEQLNQAVLYAQDAAERFKAEGMDGVEKAYPLTENGEDSWASPLENGGSIYFTSSRSGGVSSLSICVLSGDREVFSLTVKRQEGQVEA